MSDNELIAKYVKEKYPELLQTTDFAIYALGVKLKEFSYSFKKMITKISIKCVCEQQNLTDALRKAEEREG